MANWLALAASTRALRLVSAALTIAAGIILAVLGIVVIFYAGTLLLIAALCAWDWLRRL